MRSLRGTPGRAQSIKGYTLLLDMSGRIVHRWIVPGFRAFQARLLSTGNLLVLCADTSLPQPAPIPFDQPPPPTPPLLSDDIVELDPAGREVRRIHLGKLLDPVDDPLCPCPWPS